MADKRRTPKVKVEEPTAEEGAVVEVVTSTVGAATTVVTETHPTEVPTGTEAKPTVTRIERVAPPTLPPSFAVFQPRVLFAREEQWDELIDAEIHRLRQTRDAIRPQDIADWRQQLTDYCAKVKEWQDADRR